MEQRKAPRRAAVINAVVSCPQFGLFRGDIDNLSSNGLYLRTNNVSMCLHAPVMVTFQPNADEPDLTCNVDGVVVRQDYRGIGIEFAEMDRGDRKVLSDLLQRLPANRLESAASAPERLAV